VHGNIHVKWAAMGYEQSALGFPVSDEYSTPDLVGRYNEFTGGYIYYHPATGTHELHGCVKNAWKASGWEAGPYGYPTSDTIETVTGTSVVLQATFQRGSIRCTQPRPI
jgi:uncharacterized protein with LGFP repeats